MPRNILITGGTGLIGTRLTELLIDNGHQVSYLSRNPKQTNKTLTYGWDVEKQEIDPEAFKRIDAIIHLAGAGIAEKRWDKAQKKIILESRTKSTQLINGYLRENENHVEVFISASGISYYGYDGGGVWKKENSRFGDDFMATVTKAWEGEADQLAADNKRVRLVKLRTGIVLSEKGGALQKIAEPVKWYVGAALGKGDQYMSWVHIDDLCRMYVFALENERVEGTFNAVAPNPVTNKELTKSVAKVLDKPLLLPNAPAFILRIMFGEMASLVLGGLRISNEKIIKAGFKFRFDNVQAALNDLLKSS